MIPSGHDLHRDLEELIELTADPSGEADLLRRGLDWLARVAEYDLAVVFRCEGHELRFAAARGPLADGRVEGHSLDLRQFPSIRELLETRRARVFTEQDHAHGDGDPFDAVYGLEPGHACMVVPLCSGNQTLGVITLDRVVCEPYAPEVLSVAEVYGQLLAVALQQLRERNALGRMRDTERARAEALESDRVGNPMRLFEESLSPRVQELTRQARAVAPAPTAVLVLGETGAGKEQLARALHRWSDRARGPFVALNCAAVNAGVVESELFGHLKGSFTGADRDRPGRFQMANGGTIFLDEVGELPLDLQAKLLRVLQEGSFEPVGSDETQRVDCRVIAATNASLEREVERGNFREDLYYRLSVFPLRLPALRERLEDLPLIAEVLLEDLARRMGSAPRTLGRSALEALREYHWPGNLRELGNVLERAMILSKQPVLGADLLAIGEAAPGSPPGAAATTTGPDRAGEGGGRSIATLRDAERAHIERALTLTGGKLYGEGGAAELLDIKPSTLQSRMKKLGVERPRRAASA